MNWTRSETLALASQSCAQCQGLGLRLSVETLESGESQDEHESEPCNCVLRNIFRICYERFRECLCKERFIARVSLEAVHGRDTKSTWSRKDEEYTADFFLVSRRSLSESEYRIFKYHFLLGA